MINENKQKTNNDISNMAYFIEDLLDTVRRSEIYLSKYTLKNILDTSISKLKIPSTVDLRIQGNDVSILCDDRKLQVVFGNLLKYSIEAIKGQGYVSVKILSNVSDVEINFEDSGEGIESVEQNRMFEPMFSTKQNGSGLGLAISKMIVEQHGGKLVYKNHPSAFSIILPRSNSI
ncbi:MAG: ATP-binding protein [Nitrosarchaeum sp.]|nr:ATP-binding protein [Nitrosarchaeum sp.]